MATEYRATASNARISPTKVRLSAALIRGKRVEDALNMLRFQPRRGSLMVRKTLESAVANAATLGGIDPMDLVVTDSRVDKAMVIKRFRPAAKGRAAHRQKKCSHITIAVAVPAAAKV
jgi:large subunit ribosomal protein L22